MQDTGTSRTNLLDQYYTAPSIAKKCINNIVETVENYADYCWIEPSAGSGSFSKQVPENVLEKTAYDIEPKSDTIVRQDFLSWTPNTNRKILLYGNPPFGRQSKLARAFIKKGCEFADIIAFILPKSFQKPSMQTAFNMNWHCIYQCIVDDDAFLINETVYNVPCVFQIWKKQEIPRPAVQKTEPNGYCYVKHDEDYNMVVRRVGVNAGKSFIELSRPQMFSPSSHYFLKFHENCGLTIAEISEKINEHVFPNNTVGPRSISKPELNTVINHC